MTPGSTIALTGATGFIGKHLLGALALRGYQVRVLLRTPTLLPPECQNAVIGDLTRPINMSAALAGADTVIHSAGIAPSMTGSPADDFRGLDVAATAGLALAAQRAGVRRFIFMSSLRAEADVSSPEVLTESSDPKPTDPYGRSKLAAERELAKLDLDWMRAGLGREPGLIFVPDAVLRFGFRLGGYAELYRRLSEPLVGDPAELLHMGWVPRIATSTALADATKNYAV